MEPTDDDFWMKVARYVNLADNEAPSFLSDQSEDVNRRKVLAEVRELWEQSRALDRDYRPDVERGWQRFQVLRNSEAGHYRPAPAKPTSPPWWRYAAAAAAIVVAIGMSYFLRQWWTEAEEVRLTATDRKELYYLPDSSQVWLNQRSELKYTTDFNKDNRVVYLTGEAFFAVRKAEGRRFTVYSGPAKTEVIGTSFNLNAYANDSVVVQVVTGRVAFSPRNQDNAVFLTPGQKGLLKDKQRVAERSLIRDPNFRAWQNDQLVFDDTPLTGIIQLLEQQYGITVELASADLANCRYTASFNGASLAEVLDVLSAVGDLTYDKVGNRVALSGTGCP